MADCKSVPDAVSNEMVLHRKEKDDQQKALDKTKAANAELRKRVLEGAEQSGSSKKTNIHCSHGDENAVRP